MKNTVSEMKAILTFAEEALNGVRQDGSPCDGVTLAEGMLLAIIERARKQLGQQEPAAGHGKES